MPRRCPIIEPLEDRRLLSAYFVSPSGSNDASGTADAPWRTLQHAADMVAAGDTVTVRAGRYVGFHLEADGTTNARIQFVAESGAVIDTRNATTPDGINLEGADYVTVEGFRVENSSGTITRGGIRSVINTGAIIRNNVCDQNGRWGIFTGFSENLLIENNETSRSVLEHGIYVSNSADNPVVRGNRSWGNRACGLHFNGDLSQGGDGIISGALIEDNIIFDNGTGGGSGINCDGVRNSVIRNNLVYDNHASGISLYCIDGAGGSTGNLVANNTVVMAADARWCLNVSDGSTNNRVINNIFYNHHSYRGGMSMDADSLNGFISDHNAGIDRCTTDDGDTILTFDQWRTMTGQDAHSFAATPDQLFVDAANDDYRLSVSSPALDAGTPVGAPMRDRVGVGRPQGAGIDLGAMEGGYLPDDPDPEPSPAPPPADAVTATVEADPWLDGRTALFIRGTGAGDAINVVAAKGRQLVVTSNGVTIATVSARGLGRIIVLGGDGNDRIEISDRVKLGTLIDGGAGDDALYGGSGHDALHGGAGNDALAGGRGNDLLIGGASADAVAGGTGTDLLAGADVVADPGATQEFRAAALTRLAELWRAGRGYAGRIAALSASPDLIPSASDGVADTLAGGPGSDWFAGPAGDDTMPDVGRRERVG